MIDLKKVLQNNPNCLATRASFKSVLSDVYPNEKRLINILTIIYESGMANALKKKISIDENEYNRLLTQLENEYGISPQYSGDAIRCWANAFDIPISAQKQDRSYTAHLPIVHVPIVDNVVVEGTKADFETSIAGGTLTITKFIGFDEKEIVIPNSIDGVPVKRIGEDAFANCAGIQKIVVSEGITEICNGAFFGCTALKSIALPTTLKKLGVKPPPATGLLSWQQPKYNGVLANCDIEEIQLPPSLLYIGPMAFHNCKKLQKVNLPNGIKEITESCFYGCTALTEALLPDNLVTICDGAFAYTGLTSINIPASVTSIERRAFRKCDHMNQVLLHEGLTTIRRQAFEYCKALSEITIPRSVTTIEDQVFDITGWYQPYDRRRKGFSTREKSKDLVIACYAGSYGLEYARKEGFQIKNAAK